MKNVTTHVQPGAKATGHSTDTILFVGVGQFGEGLEVSQFSKFSLETQPVKSKHMVSLGDEKAIEAMIPPVVLVLGLVDHISDFVTTLRRLWPHTAVIIAADESRLQEVYPLISLGAVDYVSTNASNDELQAKCLFRIGVHHHKLHESSRTFGRLTMNFLQRTVTNGRETAYLTPIELKIVRTLVDSLGSVVERNSMKQMCWGDVDITDNALNRKIYEVRRTLRRLSENVNIRTIYGLGFELKVRS